jgi:hypothetical protein
VNPETVHLVQRPYLDVVDNLLTALLGGVVDEPILFDVKAARYPLAEPAAGIRGITGSLDGEQHTFQQGIDYVFAQGDAAAGIVVWLPDAAHPDDETRFFVDYLRPTSPSPLTDINVGSVTRTLAEAVGREIATVYEEINRAWLAGFVDTAEGTSLDLVVAILGVVRRTGEFATGRVTFFRDPNVQGNISIMPGTVLLSPDPPARFEVTALRVLQRGQARIDAPVRAAEESKGEPGVVEAGKISELAQDLAGIARVGNAEPTVRGGADETDEELRTRAKAALRALGKATLAALFAAVRAQGAEVTEAWDPSGPVGRQAPPGSVVLLVEATPAKLPAVRGEVETTRAAGVLATVVGRYVFFKPRLTIEIQAETPPAGQVKIVQQVIDAVQAYVDGLASGESATAQQVLEAAASVSGVSNPKFADVRTWRADVGQPGPATLLDALMDVVAATPATDLDALRAGLAAVLAAAPPAPTGRRVPDRSLIQAPGGGQASDAQIEAGEFEVVSNLAGGAWFVVLDMEPADVAVTAGPGG